MAGHGTTSPQAGNEDALPEGVAAGDCAASVGLGLDAKVLVLNKLYMAIRVIPARRAFSLLACDLAEVIHIDDGAYLTYDFDSWTEVSQAAAQHDREHHDWVRTVRYDIAVPRIIRLLGYDRLPAVREAQSSQPVRPRPQPLPVLRLALPDERALHRSRHPQEPGRQGHVGEPRLLVHPVQRQEGRPHAQAGEHEADHDAQAAQAQPADLDADGARPVLVVEAVPRQRVLVGRAALSLGPVQTLASFSDSVARSKSFCVIPPAS